MKHCPVVAVPWIATILIAGGLLAGGCNRSTDNSTASNLKLKPARPEAEQKSALPAELSVTPKWVASESFQPIDPRQARRNQARQKTEVNLIVERVLDKASLELAVNGEQQSGDGDRTTAYKRSADQAARKFVGKTRRGLTLPWEISSRNWLEWRPNYSIWRQMPDVTTTYRIVEDPLVSETQGFDEDWRMRTQRLMQQAWKHLSPDERQRCETYQPEFVAEASGRNAAEMERLSAAIGTSSSNAQLYWERGRLAVHRGDFQLAFQDLTRCLELSPENSSEIRRWRAVAAEELGNWRIAASDWQYVRVLPGTEKLEAVVWLGHYQLERRDERGMAMDFAKLALATDDHCGEAHAIEAQALARDGERALVIEACEKAQQAAPDNPSYSYFLANYQSYWEPRADSLASYNRAIEIDPTWVEPYLGKAKLLYREQKLAEALETLTQAAEWAPESAALHRDRAFILEKLGRREEAAAELRILVRLEWRRLDPNRGGKGLFIR